MPFFHRRFIYIQVHPDHFIARVAGEGRSIRRDCLALDNRRGELKDFSRIRASLRSIVKELAPGFSLRRPIGLMHFVPQHYVPTDSELATFKQAAERAGVSFCWLSTWETAHTDSELQALRREL